LKEPDWNAGNRHELKNMIFTNRKPPQNRFASTTTIHKNRGPTKFELRASLVFLEQKREGKRRKSIHKGIREKVRKTSNQHPYPHLKIEET